jgi:signal transduction histidine kinase
MVAMNKALVLGSLRQHRLTAAAVVANARLQAEIRERKKVEKSLYRAQAQLLDRSAQLEVMVDKRTHELTVANRQLSRVTHRIITAQEDERKLISRELHDGVVQTLIGINVELAALAKESSLGVSHMRQKIAHTQRLVENSVNAVHQLARGLRPAVLDHLGLIAALDGYAKGLAGRHHLKIAITAFAGIEALDGDERTALFRVAQEALNNVVRHARATRVKITLAKIPGAIRMEIEDNGRSFPVGKHLLSKNNKRLGLVGMRERTEMIGGTFTIESTSGEGTKVRAEIPFQPAEPQK